MIINEKIEETALEEWIDFPALDAMLTKVNKEDKNSNIQVSLDLCFNNGSSLDFDDSKIYTKKALDPHFRIVKIRKKQFLFDSQNTM
jgi:hypothetical protein